MSGVVATKERRLVLRLALAIATQQVVAVTSVDFASLSRCLTSHLLSRYYQIGWVPQK